jgi:hypothetical protein
MAGFSIGLNSATLLLPHHFLAQSLSFGMVWDLFQSAPSGRHACACCIDVNWCKPAAVRRPRPARGALPGNLGRWRRAGRYTQGRTCIHHREGSPCSAILSVGMSCRVWLHAAEVACSVDSGDGIRRQLGLQHGDANNTLLTVLLPSTSIWWRGGSPRLAWRLTAA